MIANFQLKRCYFSEGYAICIVLSKSRKVQSFQDQKVQQARTCIC